MFRTVIRNKNKFVKESNIWFVKKRFQLCNRNTSKRIILFFLPDYLDQVSGGVLSINSIQNEVRNLKKIHKCNVYLSFFPSVINENYKFTKFENDMVIFNFDEIIKHFKTLNYLEIHIPEIYVKLFKREDKNFDVFFNWLKTVKDLKINILNQNEEFMPNLLIINKLKELTTNITMTVAHLRYATLAKRNYYDIPLHLLTPCTSKKYYHEEYKHKQNIIIVSPDLIDKKLYDTSVNKFDVLNKLRLELLDYEIIVIENFDYEDYKKLISVAKFAITFGEGMDNYFIEPAISGTISFGVYNDVFFPKNSKILRTIYSDFNVLIEKIVDDITFFDNEFEYSNYNRLQVNFINNIYGEEKFKQNVLDYYLGNLDFK